MIPLPPIHPGEVLREELMIPYGLSAARVSRALAVSPARIRAILAGRAPVTADLALRLGRAFDLNPAFWLNLQQRYDLSVAVDALQDRLAQEVSPFVSRPEG